MKHQLFIAIVFAATTLTNLSAAPTIAALGVKNAASYSNPAFPNGSIARGSLFVVFGSGLGPAQIQYASSFPLPQTLAGTSTAVTMNGASYQCPMIYTSDGQIAGILPSNTPAGTGTITISYNGNSNPAPITVVTSSPGIFSVNQQGSGPGVVQDAAGVQNATNFAFAPGQTVVVWGTGLGPINGSDADVPPTGPLPGVTVTANVGGQNAAVAYAGRSQNAGVDQINITLPRNLTGCYIPLYLVATPANGTPVASNFVTISIADSGTACKDASFPTISSNGGPYRYGYVGLGRSSGKVNYGGQSIATTNDTGSGIFDQYDPLYLTSGAVASFVDQIIGSCSVLQFNSSSIPTAPQPKVLDAGAVLNISGPNGAKQMPKNTSLGFYSASLGSMSSFPGVPNSPLYLDPGNYTIDNGSGGADVGPFKLNLVVPPTFVWTNESQITTIDRSQPLLITWTGGDPNAQVIVSGASYASQNAYMAFTCSAKDSDGQLTVPAAILSMLPPSANLSGGLPGASLVVSTSSGVTGTAPGLDSLTGGFSYSLPNSAVSFK